MTFRLATPATSNARAPLSNRPANAVLPYFLACCTLILAGLLPLRSIAATAAAGYAVSDFATGFPNLGAGQIGPVGLAFDRAGNLLVTDYVDGSIYRFPPSGGVASQATKLNAVPLAGTIAGLATAPDGRIYMARYLSRDVVEVDPSNGTIIRTVATGVPAFGLQVDPLTGDLFASTLDQGSIFRLSGYASGPATVSIYSSVGYADGLAFGPDGALYMASGSSILRGTPTSATGPASVITLPLTVPTVDGMAISANAQKPYLFGNRNDGIITRVDLSTTPISTSNIVTGGTRGDFATVGPDGCIYATQTDRVLRVTNADGTCKAPPLGPLFTPGAQPPAGTVFAAFCLGSDLRGRGGVLALEGRLRLAADSNGVDPLQEELRLTVGTYALVLPKGRIGRGANGSFVFRDVINGAYVNLVLAPENPARLKGAYRFRLSVEGIDASILKDPLAVVLSIGDDSGTTVAWPDDDECCGKHGAQRWRD